MLGFRYTKVPPTTYILQYRGGKPVREGAGRSVLWCSLTDSLISIPIGSREQPFIFEEVTGDFQQVTVQGQVTYRIGDARKMAALLDFTLRPDGAGYVSEDPEKLPQRMLNNIRVLARKELQSIPLRDALRGSERLGTVVLERLAALDEVLSLGIEVMGLAILAIRPTPETSRALEAEAREQILRAADEAIYSRRNAAVEQERVIKENELNTEIAVENKKRQIRETQMDAEASIQARKFELKTADMVSRIELEGKNRELVGLKVANAREEADAKAYGMTTLMKAFDGADPAVVQAIASTGMEPGQLIALAFQSLAGKAEKIGQLNVSPDLLRELLGTGGK